MRTPLIWGYSAISWEVQGTTVIRETLLLRSGLYDGTTRHDAFPYLLKVLSRFLMKSFLILIDDEMPLNSVQISQIHFYLHGLGFGLWGLGQWGRWGWGWGRRSWLGLLGACVIAHWSKGAKAKDQNPRIVCYFSRESAGPSNQFYQRRRRRSEDPLHYQFNFDLNCKIHWETQVNKKKQLISITLSPHLLIE